MIPCTEPDCHDAKASKAGGLLMNDGVKRLVEQGHDLHDRGGQ